MRKLIYSMGVSLDGYIAGPHGEIDWSAPDEELHRFHNQQARETGVFLFGRRMYETMTFWETAEEQPSLPEVERDFARIYKRRQRSSSPGRSTRSQARRAWPRETPPRRLPA
jgi:dihydrofolate reductase